MKSRIAVCIFSIFVVVLSLSLGGCTGNMETSDPSSNQQISSPISDGANNSDAPGRSGSSDNPSSSDNSDSTLEPQKPDGEPTFLIRPDGTPIYTSEISEIYKGNEEWGSKEAITLEQAEQFAHEGGDFTVKCDGFFYGYIPEKALNRVDDPEMFKDSGGTFKFLGEMSDEKSGYNWRSVDLICLKVGDKFGDLTVKNVYTLFTNNKRSDDVPNVFEAHVSDGYIEFDGEIELEGYINVTPMETLYGSGGDMMFLPSGESSTKLLCSSPVWDHESNEYYAITWTDYCGYFGDWELDLGNMYKVDCDTSSLQPGDSFVKVKVVLDNIKYVPGAFSGLRVKLKNIEVL
ncbi:MAG: hypothetical protein K2N56_00130 [Oscillospiraceae bacterium]|nr:hypothetical protein [Oscillospiraceae bacterium]